LSDEPVSLKGLGKSEKEMIGDNESNISITFSESKSIREGKTV